MSLNTKFTPEVSDPPVGRTKPVKRVQYVLLGPDGNAIAANKENERRHPASLTKMMTLYCVMEALDDPLSGFHLDSPVVIPESIATIPPDIATFRNPKPGDVYPAWQLMIGCGSRSDARSTLALAHHLGKKAIPGPPADETSAIEKFTEIMNVTTQKIGLRDTNFMNSTGAPDENHYSTPMDMALLLRALDKDHAEYSDLSMGQPEFNIEPLSGANEHSSSLVKNYQRHVLFAKTGYTAASGYCLAYAGRIEGQHVAGVVLGAPDNFERNRIMFMLVQKAEKMIKGPDSAWRPS